MTAPYDGFATTQWTMVLRAASDDSSHSKPALEQFMQRYWQPLYQYARQRGLSSSDAEDATQEFLTRVLDNELLANADPMKGRFRSYLLVALKRFLIDQYRQQTTQKAGGPIKRWSLDVASGETQWQQIASRRVDPDAAFTLAWANAVLAQTRSKLATEYSGRGREAIFNILWPLLTQTIEPGDYQKLSQELAMSVSAIKVSMHRLRQRFGESLREIIAETVDDPREIDAELSELAQALRWGGS